MSNEASASVPIGEFNTLSNNTSKGRTNAVSKFDDFVGEQNKRFLDNNITTSRGFIKQYPKFKDLTQDFVCGRVLENGSLENSSPPIAVDLSEFAQISI
jgi:hypothetical protein